MNQFKPKDEHKFHGFLFTKEIENKFKDANIPYKVLNDKDCNRMSAMLNEAGDHGAELFRVQSHAIQAVAVARSEEDALAQALGLVKITPKGMTVCLGCLELAIVHCEDNLAALKEIKEAFKCHAI